MSGERRCQEGRVEGANPNSIYIGNPGNGSSQLLWVSILGGGPYIATASVKALTISVDKKCPPLYLLPASKAIFKCRG